MKYTPGHDDEPDMYFLQCGSRVLISLCHLVVKTIYNSDENGRVRPRESSIIGLVICYHCPRMLLITRDGGWQMMPTYISVNIDYNVYYVTSTRPCLKCARPLKLIKEPTCVPYFSIMKKYNFPLPFLERR